MYMLSSWNFRELLNKYSRWSRSRAKVTAPAPAKYPGSETLDLNTLNLDPDPGFWPNLDPDPG